MDTYTVPRIESRVKKIEKKIIAGMEPAFFAFKKIVMGEGRAARKLQQEVGTLDY
jgi:hypothetical protein